MEDLLAGKNIESYIEAETVQNALKQIKEKNYDTELISRGFLESQILHYGFAFDAKKVLIGKDV